MLTVAAQAAEGADPVQPPSKAARVAHHLGAPQGPEDAVVGPEEPRGGCRRGIPGFFQALALLEGLRAQLLRLQLGGPASQTVQQRLQCTVGEPELQKPALGPGRRRRRQSDPTTLGTGFPRPISPFSDSLSDSRITNSQGSVGAFWDVGAGWVGTR